MSTAIRRAARFSVLALIVALAPAASAVVPTGSAEARVPSRLPLLWSHDPRPAAELIAAAAAKAGEREAVRLRKILEAEALQLRRRVEEDARVTAAIEAEAAELRPGNYVWRPDRAASGPVEIIASLAAQRLYVFRAGKLIAVSTVSTGREGHRTPTGSFPILEKKRRHFSNLYNNAPMPNMQRMTWDGVALHAGNIPGHAASHGCVRLPLEFSRLLFGVTSIGSVVRVVEGTPSSPGRALAFATRSGGGGTRMASAR